MASSGILLLPSARLSLSGIFCVRNKFSLPHCSHRHVYTGAKNRDRSQRLSILCYNRGTGGSGPERAKLGNVTKQMRLLLESENLLATEAAYSLVNSMSPEGRNALVSALFPGKLFANLVLGFYQIVG